jgi:hypothetical protein
VSQPPALKASIQRVLGWVGLAAGAAVLLGGYGWVHSNRLDQCLTSSARARGEVTATTAEQVHVSGPSGERNYSAIRGFVHYSTPDGQVIGFSDSAALGQGTLGQDALIKGQMVSVCYAPEKPGDAAVDRGAMNVIPAVGIGLVGAALLLGGGQSLYRSRRSIQQPS